MKRESLPLSAILVKDRQRLDLGDLADLAESLRIHGLIQPIVVNQENQLIAGGRRLAAATSLGWGNIDVVRKETLSQDDLHILELEENIRRKDETWQERCLHIAHIHRLKQASAALDGESWSQKATGEMLGVSDCHINYNLVIARLLKSELDEFNKPLPTARFWPLQSFSDAWRLRVRDMEDALSAHNSQIVREQFNQGDHHDDFEMATQSVEIPNIPTELLETDAYTVAKAQYESNPLNTVPFDVYYAERQANAVKLEEHRNTIYLSRRLIHGNSIAFMLEKENEARFDHIITDIPYAIDVSYLNQQHPRGGMVDVDTIEELHDQDYNLKLISDFFPAAYQCTKDHAFVITWCDVMLWQFMYDAAIKAGFRVQRWPITWVKTHACLNQCAAYNFTKNTEIAIVCRKPGAMLRHAIPTCTVTASSDDLCEQVNHPFAKPEATWQYLVDAVSIEGQLILDPFAGRGSGVISMLRQNRSVIGVELDDTHYNALVENVKSLYFQKINPNFIFK